MAFEVACALNAELDVFIVRKLGLPDHEELAMGAIASGGSMVLNRDVLKTMQVTPDVVQAVAARELAEVMRRESLYRGQQPAVDVAGRTVLLVDDGLATGATMRAAVATLRLSHPLRLVVAVPIAAPAACRILRSLADEVIYAEMPENFRAVGLWYENFDQVSDSEVELLLRTFNERVSIAKHAATG